MIEDFYGYNLELDQCDALMFTRWSSSSRKKEVGLFQDKWFDHRHLHPVKATYLFGHIFTQEVRKIIRTSIDNTPAIELRDGTYKDWFPLKKGDILEPPDTEQAMERWKRKTTALIKARQTADSLGIPYEFFVKEGLKSIYFGRLYLLCQPWQTGTKGDFRNSLPSPMMLNGEETVTKILMKWAEAIDSRIQFAEHPRFNMNVTDGSQDYIAHQKWLVDQIKRKPNPRPAIYKFVKMGLLSPISAVRAFGAAMTKEALSA